MMSFHSVDWAALSIDFQRKIVSGSVYLLRAVYSHTHGRAEVWGELLNSFETINGVR